MSDKPSPAAAEPSPAAAEPSPAAAEPSPAAAEPSPAALRSPDGSFLEGDLPDDFDDLALDDVDVKDLLRAALRPPSTRTSKIRRGVQERIREQSRGRYYGDGWSVNTAPKATFLVTTLLMLLLTLLAWVVLSPIGVEVFTG